MQVKFNTTLNNLIKKHELKDRVFAVGVSGGADSLALAILLHKRGKAKIVALTVDHGLRKESLKEAKYVAKVMEKYGIEHHILQWVGEKPKSGMEEQARNARYDLMEKWCLENKAGLIFVAHHKLDQAETFMMRLQRGSGVYGLASMSEVFVRGKVKIVRPLLDFMPEDLKTFLKSEKVKWVNDPHNNMADFLRVRIRKLLPRLDKEIGLSVERIADTAKSMARVKDYLEIQVGRFIKNHVRETAGIAVGFSVREFKNLHEEIALRVLAELLQKVSGKVYTPRLESLERLRENMLGEKFSAQTLSGCEAIKDGAKIWVIPECKSKAVMPKKEWEKFVAKNPKYEKFKIPHKLRLCLVKRETIL